MVSVPCYTCGKHIDVDTMMILSGYDTICKECKCHIEASKRNAKLDKLLKKSIWRKIADFFGLGK